MFEDDGNVPVSLGVSTTVTTRLVVSIVVVVATYETEGRDHR
jgi:hypothetical protein